MYIYIQVDYFVTQYSIFGEVLTTIRILGNMLKYLNPEYFSGMIVFIPLNLP